MTTLYEKLGGEPAVDVAVDKFYDKVMADERINHFFANTNMKRQRQHQKAFMTYAFGGSQKWTGAPMRESHTKYVEEMGMDDRHFDAIVENFVATLEELDVPQELIDEAAQVVNSEQHRNNVLNR